MVRVFPSAERRGQKTCPGATGSRWANKLLIFNGQSRAQVNQVPWLSSHLAGGLQPYLGFHVALMAVARSRPRRSKHLGSEPVNSRCPARNLDSRRIFAFKEGM